MAKIDFGGVIEDVVTADELSMGKAQDILRDETVAVIGYGVQGPGQSLNMKDNGINVIVGQSQEFKEDWDRAINDGWVPGKTLFDIQEAAKRGTVLMMLVSDAAQKAIWPIINKCLNPGDALYFSHGFSIVYKDQTGVIAPEDVDVILVAPKGSGKTVRANCGRYGEKLSSIHYLLLSNILIIKFILYTNCYIKSSFQGQDMVIPSINNQYGLQRVTSVQKCTILSISGRIQSRSRKGRRRLLRGREKR